MKEDDGLFDLAPYIRTPLETCSRCQNIVAVQFGRKRLFFCSMDKRRGRYGRKIAKRDAACMSFQAAPREEPIRLLDGYYGGEFGKGVER